jgi:glycosyltransferase involved in cell wall biosynthesis
VRLGVVVPCYRQETHLPRTLRALEAALAGEEWEGVLVLSAPEAPPPPEAARGWNVIAPPVSSPLTPGASRMLGFAACGGGLVLFVDADIEVDAEWVRAALARARGPGAPGGVWGRLEEWFVDAAGERPGAADLLRAGREEREVGYLTGVALYRRDALLAAGGYDARLRSEEDFELGLRLTRNGVRLLLLGMRAGRHWSAPRPSLSELGRRWRSGLCYGQGQVLRLYVGRPGFFVLLRRQGLYIATLVGWLAGAGALLAAASGAGAAPLAAWLALALLAYGAFTLRKRSARVAALSILTWTLHGAGMVLGFLRGLERSAPAGQGGRA